MPSLRDFAKPRVVSAEHLRDALVSRRAFLREVIVKGTSPVYALIGLISVAAGWALVDLAGVGLPWAVGIVAAFLLFVVFEGGFRASRSLRSALEKGENELAEARRELEERPAYSHAGIVFGPNSESNLGSVTYGRPEGGPPPVVHPAADDLAARCEGLGAEICAFGGERSAKAPPPPRGNTDTEQEHAAIDRFVDHTDQTKIEFADRFALRVAALVDEVRAAGFEVQDLNLTTGLGFHAGPDPFADKAHDLYVLAARIQRGQREATPRQWP